MEPDQSGRVQSFALLAQRDGDETTRVWPAPDEATVREHVRVSHGGDDHDDAQAVSDLLAWHDSVAHGHDDVMHSHEIAPGRVQSHPDFCSCAIPCRSCGHESEQHAGSMWYGTGPRRCLADGCKCKGAYIGSTPARCKEKP